MHDLARIFSTLKVLLVSAFLLSSTSVFAAGETTDSAKLAIYRSGLEGMNMLKNRAIAFYKAKGYMPTNQELLETPLNDQPPMATDLLGKHHVGILYVSPFTPNEYSCPGAVLQGTIHDSTNLPNNSNSKKDDLRLMNTLVFMNVKGTWKTICSYEELGTNANTASFHLDNCLNMSIPNEKSLATSQFAALQKQCIK